MAVPVVPTWDVGTLPTSGLLNARIRDPMFFLRNRPRAVLRRTTSQALSNGSITPITWQTSDVDSEVGFSSVTNPTRYTVQTDGIFYLTVSVVFQGGATGKRDVWFRVNGDDSRRWGWNSKGVGGAGSGADMCTYAATHVVLADNDYIEVLAYQNNGTALNVNASNQDPRFQILWVSRA